MILDVTRVSSPAAEPIDPLIAEIKLGLAKAGPKGLAASVVVGAVTTVPYGSPATVTNVGSANAAELDFEIPEGKPGDDADMLRSVYDPDGDGKVVSAETADNASQVPWSGIQGRPTTFPPENHTHSASEISDASDDGRAILTAADYAEIRSLLGLDTVSPGLILLATETVPAGGVGAVDIPGIDGTYDEYEIHLSNVKPEVLNKVLGLRLSTDNAASFLATGYASRSISGGSGGTGVTGNGTETTYIPLTFGVDNTVGPGGVRGVIKIGSPANASIFTDVGGYLRYYSPTQASVVMAGGTHLTAAAHNAIRFFFTDASKIAEGSVFRLYGIRK